MALTGSLQPARLQVENQVVRVSSSAVTAHSGWGTDETAGGSQTAGAEAVAAAGENQAGTGFIFLLMALLCNLLLRKDEEPYRGGPALLEATL